MRWVHLLGDSPPTALKCRYEADFSSSELLEIYCLIYLIVCHRVSEFYVCAASPTNLSGSWNLKSSSTPPYYYDRSAFFFNWVLLWISPPVVYQDEWCIPHAIISLNHLLILISCQLRITRQNQLWNIPLNIHRMSDALRSRYDNIKLFLNDSFFPI